MNEPTPPRPERNSNRYLPYLTWLLLCAIAAWVVVGFIRRPTSGERLSVETFREGLSLIKRHYYKDVAPEDLGRAAVNGMVSELGDPFSVYLTPPEYKETEVETSGEFGGIGVTIQPHAEGLIVTKFQEGSPAEAAGMKVGDIIIEVDRRLCHGLPLAELLGMVRGPVGKDVELRVRRNGETQPLNFKIKRARIRFPFVTSRMLMPGIGIVELAQFDQDCAAQVKKALEGLIAQGMKVLILDLRGDAGGLLDQCVEICDMFLSDGIIVSIRGRRRAETREFRATRGTIVPADMPVFVLVDQQSASASEILTGALKDTKRAVIVGTRTFGKGAVNRVYPLADGSAIVLTVAHYTTPAGHVITEKGIEPDVEVGTLPEWKEDGKISAQEWLRLYREAREKQSAAVEKLAVEALRKLEGKGAAPAENGGSATPKQP